MVSRINTNFSLVFTTTPVGNIIKTNDTNNIDTASVVTLINSAKTRRDDVNDIASNNNLHMLDHQNNELTLQNFEITTEYVLNILDIMKTN